MIVCEGLRVGYDGREVLTGIDLAVAPGEMVGLLGPNGAGKTTLLLALTGAIAPTAGRVLVGGKDISRLPARYRAREAAAVPQRIALVPELTVRAFVLMGRYPYLSFLGGYGSKDTAIAETAMIAKTFSEVLSEVEGKKILVANRGISARRVLRSIRERLRAIPVLTVTDVDMTSPATAGAHELITLGPDPRSYLDIDTIIKKAKARDVVAIHPGWGFASEDSEFPRKCAEAGVIFIGSSAEAMGYKDKKIVYDDKEGGTTLVKVPEEQAYRWALSLAQAEEVARGVRAISVAYGGMARDW